MMEWHNLCAHYRTLLVCVCPKKFLETPLCKTLGLVRSNQRKLLLLPCISNTMSGLTVCVTRWWAGRDNAILPEPTSSHANCLKTRRLPPVGCTLCWVACFHSDLLKAFGQDRYCAVLQKDKSTARSARSIVSQCPTAAATCCRDAKADFDALT